MDNSNAKYDEYLRKKYLQQQGVTSTPDDTVDLSGDPGPGVVQRDWMGDATNLSQNDNLEGLDTKANPGVSGEGKAGVDAAKTLASGGNVADAGANALTTYGMATANPYAVGAGLALQTASSIKKGQNQRQQQKYLAEVEKVNARQNAINKMAQIGQSLKA